MNSGIIYRGPSLYDGAPIVVIATMGGSRKNAKTGAMLQTYILREDINPLEASKTGADASICGNCIHRGTATTDPKRKQAVGRSCYVKLFQGVLQVWKAYHRDSYSLLGRRGLVQLGAGRMVRLGTYGDSACVPVQVWQNLLRQARGWTAYSHNPGWRPEIAMQSADTLGQAQAFWDQGMRTFRTVKSVDEIVAGSEILCPASKEAGRRVTCEMCKLCAGSASAAKSIAIPLH